MDTSCIFDEAFLILSKNKKQLILLSKEKQRLSIFDFEKEKITYKCKVNLIKFLSPSVKPSLLVGFDNCQMEIIILSYQNIFKMILKD